MLLASDSRLHPTEFLKNGAKFLAIKFFVALAGLRNPKVVAVNEVHGLFVLVSWPSVARGPHQNGAPPEIRVLLRSY